MKKHPGTILRTLAIGVAWLASAGAATAHPVIELTSTGVAGPAIAVSAGSRHTCALTSDGSVFCWGANGSGQLGDGSFAISSRPIPVRGLTSRMIAISAGGYHTCALSRTGRVSCWGWNLFGQLGNGTATDSPVPVSVRGLSPKAVEIGAGGGQTCARMQAGTVECWGGNAFGQLGDGTLQQRNRAVKVVGLSRDVATISVGGRHACALMRTGDVLCWGANYWGQLGDGTVRQRSRPVRVRGLPGKAVAISAGRFYTCAVMRTGSVECWGSNFYRQLGSEHRGYTTRPIPVTLVSGPAVTVSAGARHTCVLTSSGTVECWGSNNSGQLGHVASTGDSEAVGGLGGHILSISVGDYHTCVLAEDGVECWGSNFFGQLGVGTPFASAVPLPATGLSQPASSVTAGEDHVCALLPSGPVECWGWNAFGQLGDGTISDRSTAVEVTDFDGLPIAVNAGGRHTCALLGRTGGSTDVACWGANGVGQLGNDSTGSKSQPRLVKGLDEPATAIDAGDEHTCAVLRSGTAACWGANGFGQLGDGSIRNSPKPVAVEDLLDVAAVSAGGYHTCALTIAGRIECWGANYSGQLGHPSARASTSPLAVEGLSDTPIAVTAGYDHTCALLSRGTVECWGANERGQLGNGTMSHGPVPRPVAVTGLADVVALALGGRHSCALTGSGTVACWGENEHGQLGNGTTVPSSKPVTVAGLSGPATAIAAGQDHTCALLRSGGVECWGWNFFGQLADGTAPASGTVIPMPVLGLS